MHKYRTYYKIYIRYVTSMRVHFNIKLFCVRPGVL